LAQLFKSTHPKSTKLESATVLCFSPSGLFFKNSVVDKTNRVANEDGPVDKKGRWMADAFSHTLRFAQVGILFDFCRAESVNKGLPGS
jgi:hypothetical protein